jgi:hypothetical protein
VEIRGALTTYAEEIRTGVYPAPEHTYAMPDDELALFSASGGSAERIEQGQRNGQSHGDQRRERDARH